MKTIGYLALASAIAAVAPAAHAVTLLSQSASTGITASPGSKTYTFTAGGGTGTVAFNLEGYLTLDGANVDPYGDIFTLTLNGTTLSQAYFNLGGNGSNQILAGASPTSIVYNGFNQGGTAAYSISGAALNAGTNTLVFSYASQLPQGTGDEGWGLNSLLVTGNAAVPEPATWAMMIAGFGLVGGALRNANGRRRKATVAFA